jgi:hypothetical protein
MKPLGFSLEQMGDLLLAYDQLSAGTSASTSARAELLARLAGYRQDAVERCAKLKQQVEYAEDFIAMLTGRLTDLER